MQHVRGNIGYKRISAKVRTSQVNSTMSAREDIRRVLSNLNAMLENIQNVTLAALEEVLTPTFAKAVAYTPVDTGALRDSGYLELRQTTKGPVAEIGFGAGGNPFYAAYVHERTDIPHAAPTRAKFLTSAIEEDLPDMAANLAKVIKRNAGLQ